MKTANKVVMVITGLVLLVASALKMHQLLTEPIISKGFWESWLFFVIQIPLEIGLGIWLVCGLFRRAAWLVGLLSFWFFIGVTTQKIIIGAESCGCFGNVHVDPRITLFAMDFPIFLALAIFQPRGEKLLPPPWPSVRHFFGVAIPTFILLGTVVAVLIFNKPPEKTKDYEVIKPEQWTSQALTGEQQISKQETAPEQPRREWSMLKHIDIADFLRSGIAVVLLYHNDCPDCLEAIPQYDRAARDLAGNEDVVRIAFVEVPPYGPEQDSPIPADTPCLKGKLDSTKKWYIRTPLVVVIMDSEVLRSWQDQAPEFDTILEAAFSEPQED